MKQSEIKQNLKYFKSLADFMVDNGYTEKPIPKIHFIYKEETGPFAPTANYDPDKKMVNLYVGGRHLKDILRSFAHELIHHKQNLDGRLDGDAYSGTEITEDKKLIELEKEAYLKGNISFRSFCEISQKNGKH